MSVTTRTTTYADILEKSSIASISIEQYEAILSGPLCYKTPIGITKIASELLKRQCSLLSTHSTIIWFQIEKIKEYVEKRNKINEKCMFTEAEINYLLKTTEQLQSIIEHVNTQEHTFMNLSHDVNHNIYNIFVKYIEKSEKVNECIQLICENVATELDMEVLKKPAPQEDEISSAISIEHLKYFIFIKNIDKKHEIDSFAYGDYYLDMNAFDDYMLMQAWITLLYRLCALDIMHKNERYDHKRIFTALKKQKALTEQVLNKNNVDKDFGIDDYNKTMEISHELSENLNINENFEEKMNRSLNKLLTMSNSRKPREGFSGPEM
tara:strand:- start:1212 stop:2180 length:969 start_codon:yes stop_codon:yes gene_type:complete